MALSTFNPPLSAASAAVFTTSATLSESDTNYDGQDIVIDGATVAIDGPHAFNSLLLTHGAVLNHFTCSLSLTTKLDHTIFNQIV